MLARPLLLLALSVALAGGCGSYIGAGPPPQIGVPRAIALEIDVSGDEQPAVDAALRWVLGGSQSVRRVTSGGDARLRLHARLQKETAVLAGTDCTFSLELVESRETEPLLRETKVLEKDGLTSNVAWEVERLVTDGVIWALERAGSGLSAAPPAARAAPSHAPEASPALEADEIPTPIPTPRMKKRPKRR